jgi:hypothetical protein
MMKTLITAAALSIALAPGAVLAQDQTGSTTTQDKMNTQGTQPISQELKQKLEDQGFGDVKVVPGSLIVSAKDKSGDPVTMVIGPHSMTVFTMASNNGGTPPADQQKQQQQ